MLNKEDFLSALKADDWKQIETAARAANQEPNQWLRSVVAKAAGFTEPQDRGGEATPERRRTSLAVEHIERDGGLVRLHVRLVEGEVRLSQGCSFGGARLRMNNEDTRLVANASDPRQVTFVLANPHDVSGFEKGKTYEFKSVRT